MLTDHNRERDGADDDVAQEEADGPAVGERLACTKEETCANDTADTEGERQH